VVFFIIKVMAKKMFLNRARAIPTAEAPSVSRKEVPSSPHTLSLNREEILRPMREEEMPLSNENLSGNRDVIFPSNQTTFQSYDEILPSEQTLSFSGV
jgi:hypothetical protein